MAEIRKLITVEELMELLQCSRDFIYKLTSQDRISYRVEGGKLRFHPEAVEKYFDRHNLGDPDLAPAPVEYARPSAHRAATSTRPAASKASPPTSVPDAPRRPGRPRRSAA